MSYFLNKFQIFAIKTLLGWLGYKHIISKMKLQERLINTLSKRQKSHASAFEVETKVDNSKGVINQRFCFVNSAGVDEKIHMNEYQCLILKQIEHLNGTTFPKLLRKLSSRQERINLRESSSLLSG